MEDTELKNTDEFIAKICSAFNLNTYEAKIWLTLLSKGPLDAAKVSDKSGVPRSRTYDVLESLEKKGFIILKIAKPITYMSKNPESIIETLKIEEKKNLKQQVEILEKLKEDSLFNELNAIYSKNQESVDITKILSTQKDIDVYENIRNMIRNATKSIKIIASVEDIYNILDNTGGTIYSAKKRDVDIRIIAIGKEDKTLNKFFGEDNIEYSTNLKIKAIIVDDAQVSLGIKEDYGQSIWANSQFIGSSFGKIFDMIWERTHKKLVREI